MPASTNKQRQMMAIAEHHSDQLYARNKGVLSMSHEQLHEFAATKGLKAAKRHARATRKRRK